MVQDKPYRFGDVVNGHRWTVTGWEPLESPQPEAARLQPVEEVATVVDDRPTVHYEVGDEANGHRWTGTAWVPVEAVPADAEVQSHSFGDVVDGHRWTTQGWEPVGSSDLGVDAASAEDPVGGTGFALAPPAAGWYPG